MVNHFSHFIYLYLMSSIVGEHTLDAKKAYERRAASYGVKVKRYHADNGRQAEQIFLDAVEDANQDIKFCAVGAHHQNGIAESQIKILTLVARTLLLHECWHWPEAITTMLQPLAVLDVAELHNVLKLDANGKIPLEKFSGLQGDVGIKYFHTWGCPVYVLDSRLQDGPGKIPKWYPRAWAVIYLEHSIVHANSVALVLNPNTGHVSPQFNCVFYGHFTTVLHMNNVTVPSNWDDSVERSSEEILPERFSVRNIWLTQYQPQTHIPNVQKYLDRQPLDGLSPYESTGEHSGRSEGAPTHENLVQEMPDFEGADLDVVQPQQAHGGDGTTFISTASTNELSKKTELSVRFVDDIPRSPPHEPNLTMSKIVNLEYSSLRRSGRSQNPTQRAKESNNSTVRKMFGLFRMMILATVSNLQSVIPDPRPQIYFLRGFNHLEDVNTIFDNSINFFHAVVFAANQENNQTYTSKDMLFQDDCQQFVDAIMVEVNAHEDRENWTLMKLKEVPMEHYVNGRLSTILDI